MLVVLVTLSISQVQQKCEMFKIHNVCNNTVRPFKSDYVVGVALEGRSVPNTDLS